MKNNTQHTAQIEKPKSAEKNLSGEFTIIDGKLNFTCHTQNISFAEVRDGLTMVRDEINRQIENQTKCPFHTN